MTLEDEDAALKALHGELAADTVLELIALAECTTSPVQVEVFSTHEVIGKIIDQMSQLQMLWGLNEPGALVRFREVSDVLFAASRACRASLAAAAPQAQDNEGEKA